MILVWLHEGSLCLGMPLLGFPYSFRVNPVEFHRPLRSSPHNIWKAPPGSWYNLESFTPFYSPPTPSSPSLLNTLVFIGNPQDGYWLRTWRGND